MRLLNEKDVVKVVDKHTNDDGRLDDDIACILEEVPTANHDQNFVKWLKERKKKRKNTGTLMMMSNLLER